MKSKGGGNYMIHTKKEKSIRNRASKFSKQEVDITQTPLFFPEGYEKLFIGIYFISLPYIIGVLFQYFYIADANMDIFLPLYDKSMFVLLWAIGYEILAVLTLLYIAKMALSSIKLQSNAHNGKFNQDFRIP